MPPVRTISATKPVKTERTHEENQERAYIAASRRSDRSLEARIESARRASEIHKKRTGRGLRVTEQDVVNEEMYEEEDDDLPAQYRRLTAHLQTNSMDFNRRLHAYLASQHATRAALASQYDPSFANNYQQQFPHAAQFPQHMMQSTMPAQMLPPQMFQQSPQTFRHNPYPMAPNQGYRPQAHQRSASIPTPQEMPSFQSTQVVNGSPDARSDDNRRMSLPPQAFEHSNNLQADGQTRPSVSRSSTNVTVKQESSPRQDYGTQSPTSPSYMATPSSQAEAGAHSSFSFMPSLQMPFDSNSQHMNLSPFSMSLPAESQQLLSSALDPSDPHTSMFMAGSEMVPQPQQPFYSYNPNLTAKSRSSNAINATTDGMQQTLAPGAAIHVDTNLDGITSSNPAPATTITTDGMTTPFTPSFSYDFHSQFSDPFKSGNLTRNNSAQGSADGMTPTEWNSLVDGSMWETQP